MRTRVDAVHVGVVAAQGHQELHAALVKDGGHLELEDLGFAHLG